MEELNLYRTSTEYVNYLWQFTSHEKSQVKHNEHDGKFRAYVGLLHKFNGFNYLIPLSSPEKEKYASMSERIDFLKIEVNGKLKSVIDISFMIPVPDSEISKIDIPNEPANQQYILNIERIQIRKRADEIIENSQKVYNRVCKARKYKDRSNDRLALRCLNFPLLEQKMNEYITQIQ